jgi:hypothetical protein
MRAFTDADVDALKVKHRVDRLIAPDLAQWGLSMLLLPFSLGSFDRYVDDSLKDEDSANEGLLVRHAVFHNPAEIRSARARCIGLPKLCWHALAADAGYPSPPAWKMVDPFNVDTPPNVLAEAGLDEPAAEQLLTKLGKRDAKIVAVRDDSSAMIFAAVLGEPGEAERAQLRRAETEKRGYAAACRSAADGCIAWSRSPPAETWPRYPAIPVLVLAEVIATMGGTSATGRFRRL